MSEEMGQGVWIGSRVDGPRIELQFGIVHRGAVKGVRAVGPVQRKKMKTYLKICVHLIKMKRNGYCGANAPPSPLL